MNNQIQEMAELLFGEGQPQAGCMLAPGDAAAWAYELHPAKPFCLVENWIWLDLDISEETRIEIKAVGALPSVIFAHNVLLDSANRFSPGNWVRSTLLVSNQEHFLFETRNTRYVLMGPGIRKIVLPTVLAKLH